MSCRARGTLQRGHAAAQIALGARASTRVRAASTFSYVRAGAVPNLIHELVYDETQRFTAWQSDAIPVVSRPEAGEGELPLRSQVAEFDELVALVRSHPDTFLVRAMAALAARRGEALPLSEAELAPLLAPWNAEEQAAMSTALGRMRAAQAAQAQIKRVMELTRAAEAKALDGGLLDGGASAYSESQAAALSASLHGAAVREGLVLLRALSHMHAGHIASLPAEERPRAERVWLSSIGLLDPSSSSARAAATRSPRIPLDMYLHFDAPLDMERTAEEVRDSGGDAGYEVQRLLAMEHRDRAEVGSRTILPPSLAADAPNETLAAAARALESNPSLTREDREYMLQFYADAVLEEEFNGSSKGGRASAWDVSAEKVAFSDTQPQWGSFDPDLPGAQDEARDALSGRGRYSTYRGDMAATEMVPPSLTGEAPIYGVGAKQHGAGLEVHQGRGMAPEVYEEAAAAVEDTSARIAAESALAVAAVTAALERSMGLPSRKPRAVERVPTFFSLHKAGVRVADSVPLPPPTGNRVELERAPMMTSGRGAAKGDKDAKGKGKGKK
jgi:hypothetical protein